MKKKGSIRVAEQQKEEQQKDMFEQAREKIKQQYVAPVQAYLKTGQLQLTQGIFQQCYE